MVYKEVERRRRGPRGCRRGGRRSEKWRTSWKLGERKRDQEMALTPGATRMSRHTLRGPLPLFLDRTLDRGPRYATVDPKWTLEPSCEDFDPAAVESDSASEL